MGNNNQRTLGHSQLQCNVVKTQMEQESTAGLHKRSQKILESLLDDTWEDEKQSTDMYEMWNNPT